MTKKKLLSAIFTLILTMAFSYLIRTLKPIPVEMTPQGKVLNAQNQNSLSPQKLYKVTKVIDGDTIEIETGEKIRYIGIDTPESTIKHECFGKEASFKNKELVEGKMVKLVKDVSEIDRYKRLLRYVYVNDIFINEILVKEGYANAAAYPPDIKYEENFNIAEAEAREANLGLWEKCQYSL